MRFRAACCIVLIAGLGACASVQADTVIYSQPYMTGSDANAVFSDLERSMFVADDFELAGDYELTDVHWWGVYAVDPASVDDFTIAFFEKVSGHPSVMPFVSFNVGDAGRTATGDLLLGSYPIYAYSCYLPAPVNVNGNTTYYISIYNNTALGAGDDWAWMTGNGPNQTCWWRNSLNEAWIDYSVVGGGDEYDMAFELTVADGQTVIPEPLTCLLFGGSVLLGLGRLRRRMS